MEERTKEQQEQDLKKAQEIEAELKKIEMSLSGLGLFSMIEKLYQWSQDGYPDKGFWAHLGDAFGLIGAYYEVTISPLKGIDLQPKLQKPEDINLKKEVIEKIKAILKLVTGIIGSIFSTIMKMALAVLKTAYDSFKLMLETIGQVISGVASQINAVIKTIGNAIALIKKLFYKVKNGKVQNPWETLKEQFTNWLKNNVLPYFSWQNIFFMLWDMVCGIWNTFVAAVKPIWDMIKGIYNEIKAYYEMLTSQNPLKELLKQFLEAFFAPILSMIEQIITLFLNMMTSYTVSKEVEGKFKFNFTSDKVKDSKGRFVYCSTVFEGSSVSGNYSSVDGKFDINKSEGSLNWKYEKERVKVSASIPGFTSDLKLKSEDKVNDYKLGTIISLEKEFTLDVWALIDKLAEYADKQVELILNKLKTLIENLFGPLVSTFIPHILSKTGENLSEFPKNLTGFSLTVQNFSFSTNPKEIPTPTKITIKSMSDIVEGSFVSTVFKDNKSEDDKQGTIRKTGDKLEFNIASDKKVLMVLMVSGERCILITEEQYKYIETLKNLLKLPIIAFNTVALGVFGSLYISTVGIKTALEAANSILKMIGLQFTAVINPFNKVLFSTEEKPFWDALSMSFGWPKWEDFSGNLISDINFDIDFTPITSEFNSEINQKLPNPSLKV